VTVGWNGFVYGDITAVGTITVNDPTKHFGNNVTVPSVALPAPWSCPDLADRFDCLNQVDALVSNSIGDT